jgi:hypothetical protein
MTSSTGTVPVQDHLKVKLSLCLINQTPCHECVWGNEGVDPPLLTLALDGVSLQEHLFHENENLPFGSMVIWRGDQAKKLQHHKSVCLYERL